MFAREREREREREKEREDGRITWKFLVDNFTLASLFHKIRKNHLPK